MLRGVEDSATADQRVLLGTNDRALRNAGVQSVLRWRWAKGAVESRLQAGVRLHSDRVDRVAGAPGIPAV